MSKASSRLDRFEPPRPSAALIAAMTHVNRVAILRGVPLLRDVPLLRAIPGIRGVTDIRVIDFPEPDRRRLAEVCGAGRATFITPNHPEFFTDWMIDKEVVSRVAPMAASWATNAIVNGMGPLGQRFWLANNLIAQIPGNSAAARAHSVAWALRGAGVLLHPEGMVGWHGDHVARLMPGAAEMALEASASGAQAWIAPIVWKLVFLRDAEAGLARECTYVERRLHVGAPPSGATPAQRVHRIYGAMVDWQREAAGLDAMAGAPLALRWRTLVDAVRADLGTIMGPLGDDAVRTARRWLRGDAATADPAAAAEVKRKANLLDKALRLGPFAWASPVMTQEHVAEHLKRLRADHCSGTLRDTLNRLVPRPVAPRRALLRVPEPIRVGPGDDATALTQTLRASLQSALDGINIHLRAGRTFCDYPNPFHETGA